MIDKIQDVEKASQDLRNYFKSILEGRLLSMDVSRMSDEDVLSSLPYGLTKKNRGLRYADNLCSWYTIGESIEQRFGNPYKQVSILLEDDKKFPINYSRFRYPLSFNRQKYVIFANRIGINTIDDKVIDPEFYFTNHYGEKILFVCGIDGVDKYGKTRMCAFFARVKIDSVLIRRYIYEAQLAALIEILHNPINYEVLPPIDIFRECDGGPYLFKDVPFHPLMEKLAIKIWNEEFVEVFKTKYIMILKEYEGYKKRDENSCF